MDRLSRLNRSIEAAHVFGIFLCVKYFPKRKPFFCSATDLPESHKQVFRNDLTHGGGKIGTDSGRYVLPVLNDNTNFADVPKKQLLFERKAHFFKNNHELRIANHELFCIFAAKITMYIINF